MSAGGLFAGEVVAVTGAARGLGLAIARAFHAEGASVALMDLNLDRTREAADSLRGAHTAGKAHAEGYEVDVTRVEGVADAFRRAASSLGTIGVLVNNAGIASRDTFQELEPETWRRTLEVNLTGAFLCMRAVVPGMVARGLGGRIVSIGSLAGRSGGITVSAAYAASKAGLAGLTRAAARQLAQHGILVSCVAPGTLDTDLTAGWPQSVREGIRAAVPLGRLGTVDDVTGAVLFLASKAAGYVSGVTLDVNGGAYLAP